MKKFFTKLSVLTFCCFLLLETAFAQNVSVRGKVKDESNLGVPSANVLIKGSTNGVQTDADGNYSINAPGNGTLVISFIGYVTQEIAINNRTTIDIQLVPDTKDLQQVVVIGYGTQKKRDLTGSISSIKGEEIEKFSVTNPMAALQGKSPGLTVVNSGTPGSSPTIRIRGIASTKDANPLYVVDGILQDNIDYLNPADIESIDLLKDASSTAIYGLRGANGVIAITTKRASAGKTTINVQSAVGLQHVQNMIDVVDAEGFKKLYSTALANAGGSPFDYKNYTANTNWQKEMLRQAVMNTNSINISNNNEKTTTMMSLGYNNQDGVVKYNNYKKFMARYNQETRINKSIKVGGDISGFHWREEPTAAALNTAIYAAPISPIKSPEGYYYGTPSFQQTSVGNVVEAIDRNRDTEIRRGYRINGSLFAEVKFLKDFSFRSTVYTDLGFNNTRNYSPLPSTWIYLGEGDNPTKTFYNDAIKTSITQTTYESRKYQQDHVLNFDKLINESHRISATAGFTTVFSSSTSLTGMRRDTTLNIPNDPNLWYLGIVGLNNPMTNGGAGGEESNVGAFARVSYSYKNKYLLNATIRRDASSRFAPENRWGTFGSVGLGWVISDEDFFQVKGIDFLKLRAAWGRLGNAKGVDPNMYQMTLSNASSAVFGDYVYTAVQQSYIPDPNLHFEIVQGTDMALEVRAFNNKLSAELNYYNKTTDGILTSFTLPNSNMNYFTNLGKLTNKGYEVTLGWNDRIGQDLRYNINGNFSYNKNTVNSIGNTTNFQIVGNGGINITETGKSIGYFYGYKQTGIYQSTADLDVTPHMATSLPGDISYADLNGDGVITPADRAYLGTPFPPYSYGLNLGLSYKNFDASIDGQGVAGNKIYLQRRTANFAPINYETNRLNAWTGPGTSNVEPIMAARGNNLFFSTYYLESGSYFRIRNLQIGYTLRNEAMAKLGVQRLRLYVSGQNLKTWSRTSGYTPEPQISSITGGGADNGVYPVPAIYTFGFNLTF